MKVSVAKMQYDHEVDSKSDIEPKQFPFSVEFHFSVSLANARLKVSC